MKSDFLEYLGPIGSLTGYQKSYKLILLKAVFELSDDKGWAPTNKVTSQFREFYIDRKSKGLIADINVDSRISNIELSNNDDVFSLIQQQPYKVINEKGYISLLKKKNDKQNYFSINAELWGELKDNDIEEILKLINTKICLYFNKIDGTSISEAKPTNYFKHSMKRKELTPTQKLERRIKKEFLNKLLIGDIVVSTEEKTLLFDYFRSTYIKLTTRGEHNLIDPMFALALIRIGMQCYDGKFWPHVQKILEVESFPANHQTWIGRSFTSTLQTYKKIIVEETEWVSNILLHGFVSDYYSSNLFNFLFAFYRIDIERDIARLDTKTMESLIEIMMKNDTTGRVYWLVQQTANAIKFNKKGAKSRVRHIIKLIDKCFWSGGINLNTSNRMSRLLSEWSESSKDYIKEYNQYNAGGKGFNGKKNFSTPSLKCNLASNLFDLKLPSQLVKDDLFRELHWKIKTISEEYLIEPQIIEAVTGYKTEPTSVKINKSDIFDKIVISLMSDMTIVKSFLISHDDIRFFDKDGDYIRTDIVPDGEIYSFTKDDFIPVSDAVIEPFKIGNIIRTYYNFQIGDIIRLPDGKPLSIGKRIDEGLLVRGLVNGVFAYDNNIECPVYRVLPSIFIKIIKARANGTQIRINQKNYRLFDEQTLSLNIDNLELNDRSGETGYLFSLRNFGIEDEGIYEVIIDVPNDRTNRAWTFAYIKDFDYHFEDSPYIFKTKGTIAFNDTSKLKMCNNLLEKVPKEDKYNFVIDPENTEIALHYILKNKEVKLLFDIPVLVWRTDTDSWHIEKPTEIWHSDFPTYFYFKSPSNNIKLFMDDIGLDSDEEQSKDYKKIQSKGLFDCDVTPFRSWFGRNTDLRQIYIDIDGKTFPFIDVITKSKIASSILYGDFERNVLIGEFDIVGRSNYYADITFENDSITEKLLIIEGKLECSSHLKSGKYLVCLFEDEEDDTGFGDYNYLPIGEFERDLLNPKDLEGRSIKIISIRENATSAFKHNLSCTYKVENMQFFEDSIQKYSGKMIVEGFNGTKLASFSVIISFSDLSRLKFANLSFIDTYGDVTAFLYDNVNEHIVKEENLGLPSAVRYRRYSVLYDEEFIFEVEFIDKIYARISEKEKTNEEIIQNNCSPENVSKKLENITNKLSTELLKDNKSEFITDLNIESSNIQIDIQSVRLSDIGLRPIVYNYLKDAKLDTIKDLLSYIDTKGLKALSNIQKVNLEMKNEIISMLKSNKLI